MSGYYGFSIDLTFKSETADLANEIKELVSDYSNESIILSESLLHEKLEEGKVVFFGDNKDVWRHPYGDEVVERLKQLAKDYNGVFVGIFDWDFPEDSISKRYTFYENGDIVEDYVEWWYSWRLFRRLVELNTMDNKNCLVSLSKMEDDSVYLVVTSPL